ncbi:SDR family NAD(P)-dependent oxidoreductase, partial [Nocardia sp. 004]|uniref:SDR family NAD(P)-dependent oxidoreductase n=1 Tax=Nocardia sp. 004 TaxID=3385978 RepID=UPI0039A08433
VLDIEGMFTDLPTPTPHLDLPTYPWQKTHLRTEIPLNHLRRYGTPDSYTTLGDQDPEDSLRWQLELNMQVLPWLADHVVGGTRLLPGAGYLDAALSAVLARTESTQAGVADVRFVAPLAIEDGQMPLMRLELEESTRRFTIRSRKMDDTTWTVNATGRLIEGAYDQIKAEIPPTDTMIEIAPDDFYTTLAATGLEYGPIFQRVTSIRVSDTDVVATLDGTIAREGRYAAHPAVVDAAFQSVAALIAATNTHPDGARVPVAVDKVRLRAPLSDTITAIARLAPDGTSADIDLLDAEHNICMQIIGLQFGSIAPRPAPMQRMIDLFYQEVWQTRDPIDPATLPGTTDLATLIVVMGTASTPAAERILRLTTPGSAGAELFVVGDPDREDLETALTEQLHTTHTREGADRLHLVVVAGSGYDEVDALWALRRIAVTTEEFLGTRQQEHGGERDTLGDDTFYASLITENAFIPPESDTLPNLSRAALVGAHRVLFNEQSWLRWRLIDLDDHVTDTEIAAELTIPGAFTYDHADEVSLHDGARWVTVVERTLQDRLDALDEPVPLTDPEANFRLELPKTKAFSQLGWRQCERRAPGPGEVEVKMIAIGLNYKDAMKVMGVLGERELADTYYGLDLGMEGAGVITRIGAGVTDHEIGDQVSVLCKGMIRRYNTLSAYKIFRLADNLEPGWISNTTAFLSAIYALEEVARVRPGETVLVHGAAGGVGSAAVQVAKAHGVRVIGTASTDERRAYVIEQGADHAVNSRSLDFVDEILALTDGKGADVVINSAPGEILAQNFDAVAEFGRIVELGKADIYFGGALELRHFTKNVTYSSLDLDRILLLQLEAFTGKAFDAFQKLSDGVYRPLPYQLYGTADITQAFEEVARSTQVGRVVLDMTEDAPLVRPPLPEVTIDADAQYLITGGFGGFGMTIGRWLVDKGARHLTLLGRRGATTDEARDQLAAWEHHGVEVVTETVDVTDTDAIAAVITRAHTPEHPLQGIFHTAGVLDDKRISEMDRPGLDKVYRTKVDGAHALWNGIVAAGARLDQFVLFSSASSAFGNIGQYSYTAANLAMETFAQALHKQGFPALAVGWGHMTGAGMAAADENVTRYLHNLGFEAMDMNDGPPYLEQTLRLDVARAHIGPMSWKRFVGMGAQVTLTGRLEGIIAAAAQHDSASARLRAELAALDETERINTVAHILAEQLATVMGVSAETIDLTVPVPELGLDSLMAVELNSLVTQNLDVDLTTLKLGRSFSLEQAGAKVSETILQGTGTTTSQPTTQAADNTSQEEADTPDTSAPHEGTVTVREEKIHIQEEREGQFFKRARRTLSRRK